MYLCIMIKMYKNIIFVLIIYLLINRCSAVSLTSTIGGRAVAMGRTSVAEQSLWAIQNNPAGLAYLKGWHFGVYYENQWMLRETAFKSGGFAKGIDGLGCIGLSLTQFGYADYNENKFGVAYARAFGPYLQMGLQFDWLLLHWGDNYPNRNSPCFELGVQSQVTEQLRLGAYLFNPFRLKLASVNDDALPIVMRFGLAYGFTEGFVGQCELEKDSQKTGVSLRGGFEYILWERFSIRAGVQHNPDLLSFGVGYRIQRLQVDVAAQMHQALGASVLLGLEWGGAGR